MFRLFRVVYLLRKIPQLEPLWIFSESILGSIPLIILNFLFMSTILWIWGVVGMQFFQDSLSRRCVSPCLPGNGTGIVARGQGSQGAAQQAGMGYPAGGQLVMASQGTHPTLFSPQVYVEGNKHFNATQHVVQRCTKRIVPSLSLPSLPSAHTTMSPSHADLPLSHGPPSCSLRLPT